MNRPEIKSLHFSGSFDARIGRTGFITARVPREETIERGGVKTETRDPVLFDIKENEVVTRSSKKVLSDLNRQAPRKSCQT